MNTDLHGFGDARVFPGTSMELILSICLGIGLAAACGFRVFVPLLGMSVAALSGHLTLAEGFEWVGTWPALGCLLTATILEIGAFYIPWLDNALDSLAIPAAYIAGALATAAAVADVSPLLQWSLALIAGGGVAGAVQATTTVVRGSSTLTTGGFGNFVVATLELLLSTLTTALAILVPLLCALAIAFAAALTLLFFPRRRRAAAGARNGNA